MPGPCYSWLCVVSRSEHRKQACQWTSWSAESSGFFPTFGHDEFQASLCWLNKYQARYGIVSEIVYNGKKKKRQHCSSGENE